MHLRNGDRLQGVVLGEETGEILLESSAVGALLRIPTDSVYFIEESAVKPAEPEISPADEGAKGAVGKEETAKSTTAPAKPNPEPDSEAKPNASPPADVAVSNADPAANAVSGEAKDDEKASGALLELPENWAAQVQVGYNDRRGGDAHREMSGQGKLTWKGNKNELEWRGHYRYYQHEEKKSADRYGALQRYRYKGEDGFFAESLSEAEVDNVSKKRSEVSQTAGLGYTPIQSDRLEVQITPGIKAEHIADAEDPKQNGTAYKANVQQALKWNVTDNLAIGQSMSYSVDPREDGNWDADFNAFVETQVSESTKMRLNYRRDVLNQTDGAEDKVESEFGAAIVWDF